MQKRYELTTPRWHSSISVFPD